jgi:hypothetical protein
MPDAKTCGHPVDIAYEDETGGDFFTRPCDKAPHEGGNHIVNSLQCAGKNLCAVQAPGQESATLYELNGKCLCCGTNDD